MTETIWHDQFTGTRYRCSDRWINEVRASLLAQLSAQLDQADTLAAMANAAASFWRWDYYSLLFPLRFGQSMEGGKLTTQNLFAAEATVDLSAYEGQPLRRTFLDGAHLPPILPHEEKGEEGWLLADHLLMEAALINTLLHGQADTVDDEWRHALRLAALTYPFAGQLSGAIASQSPKTAQLYSLWTEPEASAEVPAAIVDIVRAVRGGQLGDHKVQLVLVAAQRIKQYVFETSGLNEIRGASTLLDNITLDLRKQIENDVGAEAILRAAGSTLLFLAPLEDQRFRPEELRKRFFEETEIAFPAAAAMPVAAQRLVEEFGDVSEEIYRKMNVDRAQAELPIHTTLPFETRCIFCQNRSAEAWDQRADEFRPICKPCHKKRIVGRRQRTTKGEDLLKVVATTATGEVDLGLLGIEPDAEDRREDLDSLIPDSVRRRLIGVVYGDGNNFGAISLNIPTYALSLQWSARVEQTTQAAVAVALGQATKRVIELLPGGNDPDYRLKKVPFQVLSLAGEDLSLLGWAPVAVIFAAIFTHLTDYELSATSSKRFRPNDHLHFSMGVLVTDEKTPVRKSVDFTEGELLKWAKAAVKQQGLRCGTISMLYAQTAEGVPADLAQYRNEVYRLYPEDSEWGGSSAHPRFYTTIRPYRAAELTALIKTAEYILHQGDVGRMQRLLSAFYGAQHGMYAGLLHYAYQKGRAASGDWIQALEGQLSKHLQDSGVDATGPLLIHYPETLLVAAADEPHEPDATPASGQADGSQAIRVKRLPFGITSHPMGDAQEGREPTVRFSTLLDLVELMKLMS